jgi:predicted house-cleaning NTP pyrophosphatase (Maf/HAM1 superfamily)
MEAEGATPRDIVDALGEFKARKGQDKNPDAIVLGSDQVLALKGRVFGKADRPPLLANFRTSGTDPYPPVKRRDLS